jgi:hypothetical protein
MPIQLELSYLLKKKQKEDLFDSYLPMRIPTTGEIKFLNQNALNDVASSAVLGIRLQQAPTKKILHFLRLAPASTLVFPDDTQSNLQFRRLRFSILSDLVDNQGQRVDFCITYEIDKNNYQVIHGNVLPDHQWLALVTIDADHFNFLHVKPSVGPGGGGDPCAEWGCTNPDRDVITTISCICRGCG